jgi:hypothetical protein
MRVGLWGDDAATLWEASRGVFLLGDRLLNLVAFSSLGSLASVAFGFRANGILKLTKRGLPFLSAVRATPFSELASSTDRKPKKR